MSENIESFATLNIQNKKYELDRTNTSLYRFLGKAAIYDHVFVQTSEQSCAYIWNFIDGYETLALAAVQNECPLFLNMPDASEEDKKMYEKHAAHDIQTTDFFPDEWISE